MKIKAATIGGLEIVDTCELRATKPAAQGQPCEYLEEMGAVVHPDLVETAAFPRQHREGRSGEQGDWSFAVKFPDRPEGPRGLDEVAQGPQLNYENAGSSQVGTQINMGPLARPNAMTSS